MASAVAKKGRELVIIPQKETAARSIALSNKDDPAQTGGKNENSNSGTGLSLDKETQELARILAEHRETVTHRRRRPERNRRKHSDNHRRKAATILTPHMGEMSRLTGMVKSEIEKDSVNVLQTTAQMMNACIVLKGPHSLIGCLTASLH